MKRIIFMGTPEYARAILAALIADKQIEVVAVFTQPDKPVGRHKQMTAPPVKELALEHHIPVFQPNSLKQEDYAPVIRDLKADYIIVAAFGQILPKTILEIAPCINLHASILPDYRGASPIQQALLNGDRTTGVTAMLMDVGMDTGAIITARSVEIPDTALASELFDTLTGVAAQMTPEVIHNYRQYTLQPQEEQQATYCKKISKSDGEVSFADAQELYNKYRAFTPWPGVYLASGLKLLKMGLGKNSVAHQAGKILHIDKSFIEVGCERGSVLLYEVQPASKKAMAVVSYINGKRLGVGDYLA